ncbi:MAG TPA: PqqD family protein [Solirubrobacteraceae bacterium]|jgi:hypothetical protein|nr:PqqD family protein [Solirubrobacteraceae bacterium]
MHEYGSLPRARRDGLLEETVGEELLLYDQESHTAHCLSPIAACVWRHCDGERNVAELAVLVGVSEDVVASALHELREKDLLDAEPELMRSTTPGFSRREAIGRGVRYGAAAAAGSLIVSATAATPAMASSGSPCAPLWKNTTTYREDVLVEWPASSIQCWGSLKPNNKGNEPALTSEWWQKVI